MSRAGVERIAAKRGDSRDWETDSLNEHVALIKRQVDESLSDDETVQLARKIVSGRPDGVDKRTGPFLVAWGQRFKLSPAKCSQGDTEEQIALCEINAIWNFWVLNVAYTEDPAGYDMFATVRYTLENHGGDCGWSTVGLSALLRAVGFRNLRARVVSTDAEFFEHVYAMVGVPKSRSTKLLALDPTVKGAIPGWEYPGSKHVEEFIL